MKLLKFQADWCGPCKHLTMLMQGLDLGVEVVPIDVDQNPDDARSYAVRAVPTLVLVSDAGAEVKRHTGVLSGPDLVKWVSDVG